MVERIDLMLMLAELGAHRQKIRLRLGELAERLNCSKQTVHRRLLELEQEGLIERETNGKGLKISITEKGKGVLHSFYLRLDKVLRGSEIVKISGQVISGLGEGRYYMTRTPYLKQIESLLGERPYPGTLNIRLEGSTAEIIEALREMPSQIVKGFRTKSRTFGDVKYYPATVEGLKAAVIIPIRGHHRDVVEVISSKNLRKTLKLKDGDKVEIEVRI